MTLNHSATFPFVRVVGQKDMKTALLLNVIDPSIGGGLIKGSKGTAKSTTVRSLPQFIPAHRVVKGCRFGCNPDIPSKMCPECMAKMDAGVTLEVEEVPTKVIELPLNATEDRVAGTLDLEHVLETGKRRFEPGILAGANGNILYVDEINLLDDHIVDLLLDAAAMGMNYIEREGVSYRHPSRFILIGTMNPEEGDLRPQLLDRFGLMVDIKGEQDPKKRSEIISRRLRFERDPESFVSEYADSNAELRETILSARDVVRNIVPDDRTLEMAVRLSLHLGVDGHRADLTLVKTACAHAAMDGRDTVTPEDVVAVSKLVLPHRMRKNPFQDSTLDIGGLENWMRDTLASL